MSSLSLLISNRSHALENLDLDLSPLDPILISCVSPPLPTRPPTRARSSPPSGCTRTTRRPRQLRRRRRRGGDPSFGIGYKYIFLHDRVFGWSGVMIPRPSTTRERRGILGRKVERLLESKISWTRELAPTSSKINPFFIELCPSPLSFSLSLSSSLLSLSLCLFFFFQPPVIVVSSRIGVSILYRYNSFDRSSLLREGRNQVLLGGNL